jgi:hypothetical protein
MTAIPMFDPRSQHSDFPSTITRFVVLPPDPADFSGNLRIQAIDADNHCLTLTVSRRATEELWAGLDARRAGR